MPNIAPRSGPTGWSADELVIGVVGVAPWATMDFCRALYSLVDATRDWHFPRLLIDANSKIPSRGRYFDLGEADPSPDIRETIEELARAGAGVVVVPCNTAHLLYDRWARDVSVAVPHIVRATAARARAVGAKVVAGLQSANLRAHGAYRIEVETAGLGWIECDDVTASTVAGLIERIKVRGEPGPEERSEFSTLSAELAARGADTILLGCTELSAFAPDARARGLGVIDSNVELARAALTAAHCRLKSDDPAWMNRA